MRRLGLALAAMVSLAGCAGSGEGTRQQTVWVADGPPVNCITTHQIRSMRIINDQTIDFEMTGNRVFRNNLPFRCPGLSFNQAIRHNSRTSQLCSVNSITVLTPGRGPNGPTCALGQFQPLKRVPVPETPPAAG